MKNKLFGVLMMLVSVVLVLAACSDGAEGGKKKRTRSPLIPAASGNPYEVMVQLIPPQMSVRNMPLVIKKLYFYMDLSL